MEVGLRIWREKGRYEKWRVLVERKWENGTGKARMGLARGLDQIGEEELAESVPSGGWGSTSGGGRPTTGDDSRGRVRGWKWEGLC